MRELETTDTLDSENKTFITSISNRQLRTFLVPIGIGLLMLFGNIFLKLFGALFIGFSLYVYYNFPKAKVADVYEEMLVIYDQKEQRLFKVLYWDKIKSWDMKVSQAAEDQILVETNDERYVSIYMFGIAKLAVYFRKYAFEKNKHEQYKASENAKGSSFNIFGSKKKG